jgi:HK97 family phage portal protein
MLNRLFTPQVQKRAAYVDAQGRISRSVLDNYAGIEVDTETALSVPAIWRAVTMISDSISTLPLHAYRNGERMEPTPRLLERPNPLETRVETIGAMVAALILHGNYVAILGEPGASGFPESIYPVSPERVTIFKRDGRKIFRIDERDYDSSEIFHIKGFSLPGDIAGIGIIAAQRQGIGAAVGVMEYAARYFDGGTMPSYVIKSDNPDLTETEAELLKLKWMEHYSGRSRRPAVLNASTKVEPLTSNAADAQLVEARNQAVSDSANIVGIPGNFIGAPNTSRTYTNTELQAIEYIRTSLAPLTSRIEAVFTDYIPRGQIARFNFDSLLRADTLTRYQAHEVALSAGFLTVDEIRELENRAAMPETNSTSSSRELAEIIQKIYLGVGKVVTVDEAREIINGAGGNLSVPNDGLPFAMPSANSNTSTEGGQ